MPGKMPKSTKVTHTGTKNNQDLEKDFCTFQQQEKNKVTPTEDKGDGE
jgi:hypothetical protein